MNAATTTTGVLASTITGEMLNGVLSEVVQLIPVVFPVAISFLAIRKGISFVLSSLSAA